MDGNNPLEIVKRKVQMTAMDTVEGKSKKKRQVMKSSHQIIGLLIGERKKERGGKDGGEERIRNAGRAQMRSKMQGRTSQRLRMVCVVVVLSSRMGYNGCNGCQKRGTLC